MMKELEYPFDAEQILRKKKSLKRALLDNGEKRITKKIAILGGSTTSDIMQVMELFLLNYGIEPEFYQSEYNQYYQDAMFGNPELDEFHPDIIYIHTTNRNITTYPVLTDDAAAVDTLLDNETTKFRTMWDNLFSKFHCPVIQNNFEMPYYRLLGNMDASDIHGAVNFLTRLNLRFYEYAQTHEDFHICDINYISADYGLKEWSDPFFWHMYKYAMKVSAIPYLSFNVANIIKAVFGKNKKGFVLDLDNTLWGGVIGDDGVENIELGPEESEGQAYSEFQRYLKAHKQLGILLNIDSKNDHENAIAGLKHPDADLKEEDFIEIRANWDPKDRNFLDIANSLNLLPESLVFVDDNPAERSIVTAQLPGVCAPEIGEVTQYVQNIDRNGFFEAVRLTKDDLRRNEMYKENAQRNSLKAAFADYGEYLHSLEMNAVIRTFEPVHMARIAQLTNKSNQFNLTTRRYTQSEIEEIAANPEYIPLAGRLSDRFGDNGVVSVVIGHVVGEECLIDLWIMSCRVLKRDMEFAMMDTLEHRCREKGVKRIRGFYYPTAKNNMVREFYALQGFTKVSEDEKGNTEWVLTEENFKDKRNRYINVTED